MWKTLQTVQEVSATVKDVRVAYVYIEINGKAVQWNVKMCSVWTVTTSGINTNAFSCYTKHDLKTALNTFQIINRLYTII